MQDKQSTLSNQLIEAFDFSEIETTNSIQLSELREKDIKPFEAYMLPRIRIHHISKTNYQKRQKNLKKLKKHNVSSTYSPYPHSPDTRKGNFAEIFLAEYLQEITTAKILVYRLRHNPNPEQSMKGDDVLLFDLSSKTKHIIVGESKFRSKPNTQTVKDITDGLKKSHDRTIPVSIGFVADHLRLEGKLHLAKKIDKCYLDLARGNISVDYFGMLMSNNNGTNNIINCPAPQLDNIQMISVVLNNPDSVVEDVFNQSEKEYESI